MSGKIIVIEDDDIAGDLAKSLLRDAGFDVELLVESRKALERIRQVRPDLIVLDILMPGVDGLNLCRQIKGDPALAGIRVAMVSAKSFPADKAKAKEAGADTFIAKPYDIETFPAKIAALMSRPPAISSLDPVFRATIWGSRSSRAPREAGASRYGRHTPCVQIDVNGKTLLFDAGTGAAAAGRSPALSQNNELWIFLSHFHSSHTEGLADFLPLSRPDCTIHFCAAPDPGANLADLLRPSLEAWTKNSGKINAHLDLYEISGESYEIFPGVALTPFYANHPGTTLGFVLESSGRKMAYCPDDEIYGNRAQALQDHDERLSKLYSEATLVLHDARYSVEDYARFSGRGHSNFLDTVDLAGKSNVRKLVLFHQDAKYSDLELDRMGAAAASQAQQKGYTTQVITAKEDLRVSA